MAGRTPTDFDTLQPLLTRLASIEEQLRNLQRPSGTQLSSLVEQVQAAIANIGASVTSYLAGGFSTGSMTASGNIDAAGRGTFTGGLTSADVKARVLSVGYDSVYIDANNIMGKSPSARRFKQDIEYIDIDSAVIDGMRPARFRLIGAVDALGDEAPYELGLIADDLDEIGLGAFVTRDGDGEIAGIAYERLCVPLVAAVKELRADVREIRDRLDQSQ